jgi:lipopolysaccharide/colanic/teichoic acid biosynthesis glycosyltransferase
MYFIIKRLGDVLVSSIALVILLPLFIPIILILRLTGEGEVFYLQDRIGYKNKSFKIWKFATMLKNSPNIGTRDLSLKNDPRILPFGKFLRKTKINELPQLLNVLFGDMSIVGPRPLMLAGFNSYNESIKNKIYNFKPGLTGIGSIVFRDEDAIIANSKLPPRVAYESIILPYKGELEMWYQKQASILLDIKLIFLTAWNILFPSSELYKKWFKDLPPRPF